MLNGVKLLWAMAGLLLVMIIISQIKIHDLQNVNNIQQATINMLIENQRSKIRPDTLVQRVTKGVLYKPVGSPPSCAKPECYEIRLGNDYKYRIVLPGGTVLVSPYNTYEEAMQYVCESAAKSMNNWLTYGGF